jgi:quercetin dioxygenase-like cupin family protein
MGPNTKAPLHLHPCSTIGIVTEGTIAFQIEGKETTHLNVGDAFHEPKNTRVSRFNNESDSPAKFIVFYLFENKDDEIIMILEK